MAEIVLVTVQHDGVTYPVNTKATEIKGLSAEQKDILIKAGAIGEPEVHAAVQSELEAKDAQIEELKKLLAEAAKPAEKK